MVDTTFHTDMQGSWAAAIAILRSVGRPGAERIAEDPNTDSRVARALRLILCDERRYASIRRDYSARRHEPSTPRETKRGRRR
jgi:hypothetical protein